MDMKELDKYTETCTYSFDDEEEIKKLLMFHKVVSVYNDDTLVLDNGVALQVLPNIGCGGCEAGNYHIENIANAPNVITNVEFDEVYNGDDDWCGGGDIAYKIYVICEGVQGEKELLSVEGNDGNGYYGTGYQIRVLVQS